MSGMFTSIFNPGISVSDGSDDHSAAGTIDEGSTSSEDTSLADSEGQAQSGGSTSDSLSAQSDIDLGLEVTLSNEVQMSWTDDQGNVQTYSQSDELTISADVENTLDTLLTSDSAYAEGSDYTA